MNNTVKYGITLVAALLVNQVMAANTSPTIYAAGSLRTSIDDIVKVFEQKTGIHFDTVYGPSGKLRSDIEGGMPVGIFASASIEHTDVLAKKGLLKDSTVFAKNSMCLLAAPGINIDHADLIEKMLSPELKLGTSTPKMDPGGDYAWAIFRNAEKIHPGAYASLDQKAQKLVGNPALPPRSVPDMLKHHEIDLFITYCSYANESAAKIPGITWQKFPAAVNVEANYGIGVSVNADDRSNQLERFILSDDGQKIIASHGLEAVLKP